MDEILKKAALENLQRLVARIKELEEKVGEQEKRITLSTNQLAKLQGNRCWWDGELCQRCSAIRGLQDCGIACSQCQRLDKERLWFVLDRACIFRGSSLSIGVTETEGKEDGLEEAWEEIHEEILALMAGVGVEPAG